MSVNVVELLLDASLEVEIDVNAFDNENKTPFTMACIYGHFQVAKLMIEKSRVYQINLNLVDHDDDSAFKHAITNANLDIANLMVDNAQDQDISLNLEDDFLREKWLEVHIQLKSFGDLVFGRRPDLWTMNPLMMSSLLTFFGYMLNYTLLIQLPSITILFHILWLVFGKEVDNTALERNAQCSNQNFSDWLEVFTMQIKQQHQDMNRFELIEDQTDSFLNFTTSIAGVPFMLFALFIFTILFTMLSSKSMRFWSEYYQICLSGLVIVQPQSYIGYSWRLVEVITNAMMDYFPLTLMLFGFFVKIWMVLKTILIYAFFHRLIEKALLLYAFVLNLM